MTADPHIETIRSAIIGAQAWVPDRHVHKLIDAEEELRALAARLEAAEARASVLPDDEVCACLHETGERKTRLYERCERCGQFMQADYVMERLAAEREAHKQTREALRHLGQHLAAYQRGSDERHLMDMQAILDAALGRIAMTDTQTLAALKERLYAALKHSKGCSCGECSGGLNAVDALVRRVETAERDLRREWWLNHGHDFARLYGDDGEMQCDGCADFKRQPLDELRDVVKRARMERSARVLAEMAAQDPPAEKEAMAAGAVATARWLARLPAAQEPPETCYGCLYPADDYAYHDCGEPLTEQIDGGDMGLLGRVRPEPPAKGDDRDE